MELLLVPCRAASARPLLPTSPGAFRRAGAGAVRTAAAASSSNVEVIDDATATTTSSPGAPKQWSAGGLGLELSEEMRRGMMWRMLAPPAAAVAADAAFLGLLERAQAQPGDVPSWAAAAGSAVLFAAGLLGVHYGFLSSRWDAAEAGSVVGWDLAVRHWNFLTMAKEYSSSVDEEEEEEENDDEEYYEDEEEDEDSD